ncbi:flagellin [Paenibacillus sp.]|uniref:flagellin n=1 Tax=Paenibacillus sp. TaxID=58172 RepID=UPI002D38B613|nr:flagellin [Paenibacillus sp.]HZG86600.1 flagellin [Paenibacillus sp.]
MTSYFATILRSISNYNRLENVNRTLTMQLSTGKKINSPSDNPFLYRKIQSYEAESAAYESYLDRIDEGAAVVSVVSDAASLQLDTLEKMLEIANQVRAGGLSTGERTALNEQYEKLTEELNEISANAGFDGKSYLDGTYANSGSGFKVATGPGESYEFLFINATAGSGGLDVESTSVSSVPNANAAVAKLEAAVETLNGFQQRLGTGEFILESRAGLMESKQRELDELVENYQEVDPVRLSAELERNRVLQQYALAAIGSVFASQQNLLDYLFPR